MELYLLIQIGKGGLKIMLWERDIGIRVRVA